MILTPHDQRSQAKAGRQIDVEAAEGVPAPGVEAIGMVHGPVIDAVKDSGRPTEMSHARALLDDRAGELRPPSVKLPEQRFSRQAGVVEVDLCQRPAVDAWAGAAR